MIQIFYHQVWLTWESLWRNCTQVFVYDETDDLMVFVSLILFFILRKTCFNSLISTHRCIFFLHMLLKQMIYRLSKFIIWQFMFCKLVSDFFKHTHTHIPQNSFDIYIYIFIYCVIEQQVVGKHRQLYPFVCQAKDSFESR